MWKKPEDRPPKSIRSSISNDAGGRRFDVVLRASFEFTPAYREMEGLRRSGPTGKTRPLRQLRGPPFRELPGSHRVPAVLAIVGLEQEELNRDVRVEVIGAHEGDHLAAHRLLHEVG